jgi:hypothetical protein
MATPDDLLDETLASFVAMLEPDLARMRRFAPRFVSVFTEAVLTSVVLEHALRKKGLLSRDEIVEALEEAQEALGRVRARGAVAAGSA